MWDEISRATLLRYTHIPILKDCNLPKVNLTEYTYIGSEKFTEAQFFNLIEGLRLFKNMK